MFLKVKDLWNKESVDSEMPKDKKDEREKPLLTKGKRHKVVRFLISPKKIIIR